MGVTRVVQGKRLPNIDAPDDCDEVDLKLIEHVKVNEDWTYRSAAKHAGVSVETAFRRIRRIRRSDFVTAMREDLQRLGGKISDAISDGLDSPFGKDRASIALRLASGLGVLIDKSERKLSWSDATPEQIAEAIARLSDDDLAGLIAQRSAPSGA